MTLADWLREATDSQRAKAAEKAGTSVGYLYLLAGGHRRASTDLAKKLEKATSKKVTRAELRPDVWGDQAA